ncbi:MAG: DUF4149 domain-containing protein, partial [Desulfocapsaceae bacterium]|nr:DUF4149 domain-containing protein [Desulfocapsaceae bacterium]
SCWLGGSALFTFVLTPTLFKSYPRDMAGSIVGALFPGYFQWGLACGAVGLTGLLLGKSHRKIASGLILTIMLSITATQAFIIEPRAAELKRQIPSFETTRPDHPLRIQFRKLHGVSAVGNLAVIGAGVVLVILSFPSAQKKADAPLA